jgi:hypothetical protein
MEVVCFPEGRGRIFSSTSFWKNSSYFLPMSRPFSFYRHQSLDEEMWVVLVCGLFAHPYEQQRQEEGVGKLCNCARMVCVSLYASIYQCLACARPYSVFCRRAHAHWHAGRAACCLSKVKPAFLGSCPISCYGVNGHCHLP